MFVVPIAGIDHAGVNALAEIIWRSASLVTYDHDIYAHSFQVARRIAERLTLGYGRTLGAELHDISTEAVGGQRETAAGARAVLEKQVHHHFAPQGRRLFDRAAGNPTRFTRLSYRGSERRFLNIGSLKYHKSRGS